MKILIIAYPSLKKDPRPFRQIKNLYKDYELHTIGASKSGYEKVFFKLKKHKFFIEFFRVFLLKMGLYKFYYWDRYKRKILKAVKKNNYDLIIVHEIRLLPLALKISNNSKIILDAHEYSPKNFDDSFLWRFFIKKYYTKLCKDNLPFVDKVITVSPGIVNAYKDNFKTDTVLITNACEYEANIIPSKIDSNLIKIIHHGTVSSSRKLELLIEMMNYLDNDKYQLNLMLVSSFYLKNYLNKLKRKAHNLNIIFLDPVERKDLIHFSNKFDIGIHFVPPTNFNLKYGLGNKFFEFIQSRLAIAIGPDIEMSSYVKKYNLGMIADDWSAESIAKKISSTNIDQLTFFKNQAHKYAKKLSSNNNDQLFKNIIDSYK